MNFDKVGQASALGFTEPSLFGIPKFDFVACLTMIIVLMITAVESTGSTMATDEIVIAFEIADPAGKYHVPVLLSPYAIPLTEGVETCPAIIPLGKNQYGKAESHVIRIYRDTSPPRYP